GGGVRRRRRPDGGARGIGLVHGGPGRTHRASVAERVLRANRSGPGAFVDSVSPRLRAVSVHVTLGRMGARRNARSRTRLLSAASAAGATPAAQRLGDSAVAHM